MALPVPGVVGTSVATAAWANQAVEQINNDGYLIEDWSGYMLDYTDQHPASAKTWHVESGTQPSIGAGQIDFRWGKRPGKRVRIDFGIITAADTNYGSNLWRFRFPNSIVQKSSPNAASVSGPRGLGSVIHTMSNATRQEFELRCYIYASDYFGLGFRNNTSGSVSALGPSSVPWTDGSAWAANDWIEGYVEFESN